MPRGPVTTIIEPQTDDLTLRLPVELLLEIIKCMNIDDQRNISLVSRAFREQALHFAFRHLSYSRINATTQIYNMLHAGEDVKAAIKKLQIQSELWTIRYFVDTSKIFRFLRSLPNLQIFEFAQEGQIIKLNQLPLLIDSLRHAPISELLLKTGDYSEVDGPPPEGLSSLKKLSIAWSVGDTEDVPGSSIDHLFRLIRPSLNTLIELEIENLPRETSADLDLFSLRDAGNTLRVFAYTMRNHDEGVLDVIPGIFPHLRKLALTWSIERWVKDYSLPWKDAYLHSLSNNTNVEDLQLSFDFEEEANDRVSNDEDYAWYIRCYRRRLTATTQVSEAMPKVRNCAWLQLHTARNYSSSMLHPFVIEKRARAPEGGEPVSVVRGLKQRWMGGLRSFWVTGVMVDCRLENLPGAIIGENEPEEESPEVMDADTDEAPENT